MHVAYHTKLIHLSYHMIIYYSIAYNVTSSYRRLIAVLFKIQEGGGGGVESKEWQLFLCGIHGNWFFILNCIIQSLSIKLVGFKINAFSICLSVFIQKRLPKVWRIYVNIRSPTKHVSYFWGRRCKSRGVFFNNNICDALFWSNWLKA